MLAVKYRVSNGAGTVPALNTRNPLLQAGRWQLSL